MSSREPSAHDRVTARVLLVLALAIVLALRLTLLGLPGVPEAERAAYRFAAADGTEYPYLGDFDSYVWLRNARNVLATGTSCDVIEDGRCLDRLAPAPMGGEMRYARSLHITAIVALHRIATALHPGVPLERSAALVPLVVGTLGVLPAFALGRRLGGPVGGLVAALASALSPIVLLRTLGGDNDVWNVVLPLALAWAATRAASSRTLAGASAWAAVAALFTTLHAATWSGWVLTQAIVAGGLTLEAARRAARALATPPAHRAPFRARTAIVVVALVVWWVLAGMGVALAAPEEPYLALPLRLAGEVLHRLGIGGGAAAPVVAWPDVFATVSELLPPDLGAMAAFLGGPLLFFVSWLGLLVLLLPDRRWQRWHVATLVAGTLLYRWLLTAPDVGRTALLALLAVPPLAILAVETVRPRGRDARDRSAALVTTLWFLATLLQAFDGLRYVMLLAPPCALAAGAAVGRLHSLLGRTWRIERRGVVRRVLFSTLGVVLALPWVATGWTTARAWRPAMQDGWWDALSRIRIGTAPDTIVFAWWDYGYWVKYVAERRVAADGGLLRTHVPYWMARALLAPSEAESVGLLRMLACGSDATPEPEGADGAYGRLLAAGIDPPRAPEILGEIAPLERAAAAARLDALGLDAAARDAVLRATHCDPPPALLVVPDGPAADAWSELARWSFIEGKGPAAPPAALSRHACDTDGPEVRCPIEDRADTSDGGALELFWPAGQPAAARFRRIDDDGAAAHTTRPAWLGVLAGRRLVDVPEARDPASGGSAALGALIDPAASSVLVGGPELLRATHTRLTELDGAGLVRLTPFDDRSLTDGGRLRTWRIVWPEPQPESRDSGQPATDRARVAAPSNH